MPQENFISVLYHEGMTAHSLDERELCIERRGLPRRQTVTIRHAAAHDVCLELGGKESFFREISHHQSV